MSFPPALLLLLGPALALAGPHSGQPSPFRKLFFEPNRGQTDSAVRYIARAPGANIAWTDEGMVLQLAGSEGRVVSLRFPGASPKARFEALEDSDDLSSYYIGADASRWVRDVPHYRRLAWRGVYPGIDLIFYGQEGRLEYDFVVTAGADPSRIRMAVDAAAQLSVGRGGDLTVHLGHASFEICAPRIYQRLESGEERKVEGGYRLNAKGEVRLKLGRYDAASTLVIDPVLTFADYYGGESDDSVTAVTSYGDIVGVTNSLSFTFTATSRGKDGFAYVGGYALPSTRLYIFGGSGDDVPTCAVGNTTQLVVGGWTNSPDFLNATALGGMDGFLLGIDRRNAFQPSGAVLVGGSGDDRVNALNTSIYSSTFDFAGETTSTDMRLNGTALSTQASGGIDAFFGRSFALSGGNSGIYNLAYFGGSGDDRAYAIASDNRDRIVIAGKTTSPDIPLRDAISGQLNGSSDAFLARFVSTDLRQAPQLEFGTYLGGSGDDEIRSLAVPYTYQFLPVVVYFSGTTNSTDLPLVNPAQPRFGGGDTDAFAGRIDLDSRSLVFNTYIGGSGRDEGNAIATGGTLVSPDALSYVFVAGTTASADLPLSNPLQDHLAGPRDAFIAWLDPAGNLLTQSYFGGSGSENVHAVGVSKDNVVTIAGDTDSPDLPLPARNSSPSVYTGGLDGFTAGIELTAFGTDAGPSGYWTGLDFTVSCRLAISGDVPKTSLVTVTVADPALATVSFDPQVAGSPTVSLPLSALGSNLYFYLTGLASSGETTVTIALDGFAPRQVRVRLGSPVLLMNGFSANTFVGSSFYVSISLVVPTGASTYTYGTLRQGAAPIQVSLSLSDQTLGTLDRTQLTLSNASANNASTRFTATAGGLESISAVSSGLPVANSPISTNIAYQTITLADFAIGKNLERGARFSANGPYGYITQEVTVTSDDPARLCIVQESSCQSSVRLFNGSYQTFTVRALDDTGVAHLLYSSANEGSGSAAVQLTRPRIFALAAVTLTVGTTSNIPIGYGATTDAGATSSPIAGFNPALALTSSDATVADVVPSVPQTATIKGIKPGRALIRIAAAGFDGPSPVAVTVTDPVAIALKYSTSAPVIGGRLVIGKDLQVPLYVGSGSTGQARVTSSNPSLLLISSSATDPGSQQASLSNNTCYLQALTGTGSATITISVAGFPDLTVPVVFQPSGFAFTSAAIALNAFSTAPIQFSPFVLDAASGAPLSVQGYRPGVSPVPAVVSSNPAAGSFSSAAGGTFTAGAPGSTVLSLVQPDGFNTPSVRGSLLVVVNPAIVSADVPALLGRDLQTSFTPSIGPASGNPPKLPITVTSGDPSRLQVSLTAGDAGSGQISTTTGSPVYLQSLAADGVVMVRISGTSFDDAVYPVTLTPAGVRITPSTGYYRAPEYPVVLTTLSQDAPFTAGLFSNGPLLDTGSSGYSLRPGAAPIQVPLTNTNSNVALPSISLFSFAPGGAGSQPFTISPRSPGDTVISVIPPAAFHTDATHEQAAVRVTLPLFDAGAFSVGRDFQTVADLRFSGGSLPTTIVVTLRSNDPSRVLLATRPDQAGQSSISLAYGPNASSPSYYVQGIAEGQTSITASASSFADTAINVTVTTPALSLSGPETAYIGFPARINVSFNYPALRPGAQVSIVLHSSDPSIAQVDALVVASNGSGQAFANITALRPGNVTISADLPSGYTGTAQSLSVALAVSLPLLPFDSFATAYTLGKDLQVPSTLSQAGTTPLPFTITSSDPSKVLISAGSKTVGQASVSATIKPYERFTFLVQALSDQGSATLTFSSPGYNSMLATVNLAPSFFTFETSQLSTKKNSTFNFQVDVTHMASYFIGESLRAGASPVSITISSSAPGVGTVKTPVVVNPGDSSGTGTFTAAASGSTILSIVPPPGFVTATSKGTLVVVVN